MEFTEEQISQAYACKTPEELIELAKANNVDLSEEDAQAFLEIFAEEERAEGELADEELENVAGGAGCPEKEYYVKVKYQNPSDIVFLFNRGDVVQAFVSRVAGSHTATVRVVDLRIVSSLGGYYDEYKVEKLSGCGSFGWENRSRFEKQRF